MSGRRLHLLLLLAGAALLPLLVAQYGPGRTFSLWNIPVLAPGFADARALARLTLAALPAWMRSGRPAPAAPTMTA